MAETIDCFPQHIEANGEEQHRVGECGEDLKPIQAERSVRTLNPSIRHVNGRERHANSDQISEHVPSVGEQRQRVGDERPRNLDHQEHRKNGHHGPEPSGMASPGPDRHPMGMPVSVGIVRSGHRPMFAPPGPRADPSISPRIAYFRSGDPPAVLFGPRTGRSRARFLPAPHTAGPSPGWTR